MYIDKETILNLLDSVGPHQLCSLLNEVIHELFSTSHFISIQRLDSSVKSLIKDFLNQTDNDSSVSLNRRKKKLNLQRKSNNKSTQNKTSDFFIFSTDHESGSSKNSVKSFVVKLDHVKNVELRDLLLLERQTIGVPKFVVICLVGENETWENGILISFCLTKFLTNDRKLLEMFTVKLHTLTVTTTSMTLRKGLAQPIMKCQFDTKNDTSNPIQEQTCFDLVKLSHDLLQQMTQRTDYSHGVLMFSTDDSDKLLCIASSNDLFVGEQTVQIQKSIFETHLTSCENSAIYEIEEMTLTNILQNLFNEKRWNLYKSSSKKSCFLMNLGCLPYNYHVQDTNSHLMINTSNNLNINFYLVAYLWSICTNESSNSVNDCLMNSRNEYSQVNNLLTLYRQELSEACRLRYLFDWNILNQNLRKEMTYFSQIDGESNLYENVADSLKKFINYDSISIYHFDKNEQEWIEELKQYPLEKQVLHKRRWSKPSWIFKSLLKQMEVNNHEEIFKSDSVDIITNFINQLDSNVYLIDFSSYGTNLSTIIELSKHDKNDRFSRHDRYLLSHCITGFLSVLLHQVNLKCDLLVMRNRNEVNTEMVAYHMKVSQDEVTELANSKARCLTELHPDFNKITFLTRSVQEKDSTEAIMIMFENLGFITQWNIHRTTLACFILTVKKNYRTPTYHNWMHAFTVGHMAYLVLTVESQLTNQYLNELERLALFVGALCHDIDHRGFNNSYQMLTKSPLAALYGHRGSVLEHHHVDQTMRILSLEGCDIFSQMKKEQYERMRGLLKQIILATDLCEHIVLMPTIIQMTNQAYNPCNEKHHELFLSLLVTACDLNDQCKNWYNTREAAKLIYHEFFIQGDFEKSQQLTPLPSLDRNKAFIPELQINFLESIVLPCFKALSSILPNFQSIINTIEYNQQIWRMLSKMVEKNELNDYTNELLFHGQYDKFIEDYINFTK
ncbi:unnamed protein product [Heterobilharzia americana]|nr:unnamed protein product [Heterobilharzia americana]